MPAETPHAVGEGIPNGPVDPTRQRGYDAVYAVIQYWPGDAERNAVIWRAVMAYEAVIGPGLERLRGELADTRVRLENMTKIRNGQEAMKRVHKLRATRWKARAEQAEEAAAEWQAACEAHQTDGERLADHAHALEDERGALKAAMRERVEQVLNKAADDLDAPPVGGEALKGLPYWYRQGVHDAADLLRDWSDSKTFLAALDAPSGAHSPASDAPETTDE